LAAKEAEYMQNLFKTTLGIDLKIDKQIFKQRLAKMQAGEFDIVSAGWGPDYSDAMTFVDLFASWNGNNVGQWYRDDYDLHIRKALNTVDQKIRMAEMASAEKILLNELPIVPTYERVLMFTHSDKVQGIVRRIIGADPDLTGAKVVQ
jgi:oligopeptide transport system substrate-binding protein